MKILKKISFVLLVAGYLVAGINHFKSPASYWRVIPSYFPFPHTLNILAGVSEILFALLLIAPKTRQLAAKGIILMLIAFIPVHTKMVADAPFLLGDSITVTPLTAWLRLIVFQPLLILWAWWYTKPFKFNGN